MQLPLFNEIYVVERLLKSVSELDYPRERLQIQVLDDSTDETRQLTASCAQSLAERGFDVELIHRTDRVGYKAGALEAGSGDRSRRISFAFSTPTLCRSQRCSDRPSTFSRIRKSA